MAKSMDRNIPQGMTFGLSDEQIRSARQVVASNAKDSEDCSLLFDILGLLPQPPEKDPEEIRKERKQERDELRKIASLAKAAAWAKQLRECGPTSS